MGPLLPPVPPSGGHRGALYAGDLYEVIREAAYRPDVRAVWNNASNMTAMQGRSHLWTLYAGDPDPRKQTPRWEGAIVNVIRGMVPEFTWVEHMGDPESGIHCLGWRTVLKRCLGQKVIRPTVRIVSLLGWSECFPSSRRVTTTR